VTATTQRYQQQSGKDTATTRWHRKVAAGLEKWRGRGRSLYQQGELAKEEATPLTQQESCPKRSPHPNSARKPKQQANCPRRPHPNHQANCPRRLHHYTNKEKRTKEAAPLYQTETRRGRNKNQTK